MRGHIASAYLVGSNMLRAYLFFIYDNTSGGRGKVRVSECQSDLKLCSLKELEKRKKIRKKNVKIKKD